MNANHPIKNWCDETESYEKTHQHQHQHIPEETSSPLPQQRPMKPLCRYFVKGLCIYGERCNDSHQIPPDYKLPLCKFFIKDGTCKYGQECIYRHVSGEKKKTNKIAVVAVTPPTKKKPPKPKQQKCDRCGATFTGVCYFCKDETRCTDDDDNGSCSD